MWPILGRIFSALSMRSECVEPFDDSPLRFLAKAGAGESIIKLEEFDPGSERTLAAWLRHASRTDCALLCS